MTAAAMMGPARDRALGLVATAMAASLVADSIWFWNGRRHGRRVLGALCRLSLSPDYCVRQTETLFVRLGLSSLLFAKFVPGLGKLAIALAGVTRARPATFFLFDAVGAALYVGVPIGLGWVFRDGIADILATLAHYGPFGLLAVAAALLLYLGTRWCQRQLFIRRLRMDRITVGELIELIDGGKDPVILDVRGEAARGEVGIIPGALAAHAGDPSGGLEHYPRDRDVVVYCACPNEASAAIACRHLKRLGFKRIRPLLGGVDAWVAAGRALEMARVAVEPALSPSPAVALSAAPR
jgi:membrane protein DedA with SNARE-associated domain/rhodanese-related sulfurtransferase